MKRVISILALLVILVVVSVSLSSCGRKTEVITVKSLNQVLIDRINYASVDNRITNFDSDLKSNVDFIPMHYSIVNKR